MEDSFKKTKLQRRYYLSRLISIGVNYTFFFSIVTIILGLLPLVSIFFIFGYLVYAIFASLFLIVVTFFLVLLNVNDPDNPLHIIWSRFSDGAMDQIIKDFSDFSKVATPIASGVVIFLSIVLLILVSNRLGKSHVVKDRTLLVLSIIFSAIGVLLSLINWTK